MCERSGNYETVDSYDECIVRWNYDFGNSSRWYWGVVDFSALYAIHHYSWGGTGQKRSGDVKGSGNRK